MRSRKTRAAGAGRVAGAAAAACLAAALLSQGGRVEPALDVLTHFAPLWLAGAAASALWAAVRLRGPRRGGIVAIGLAGTLAAGALMAPEALRPGPARGGPPGAPRLRLIEFNTWDDLADPGPAAAWIDAERPDVVVIDEATPALRRALIARGFAWRKGMVTSAIFSRGLASRPTFFVPTADWAVLPDFARASFAAPGGEGAFTVVNVHLSWPYVLSDSRRAENFAVLLDRQQRSRQIIAGDFNLTPWSFALQRLDRRLGLTRLDRAIATWPARRHWLGVVVPLVPVLAIDHIYVGRAWRLVSLRRGPDLGSDHYPLEADLALTD